MALVSLGDMAHSFMLRRQNLALKSDLQQHATELTTGRVVDLASHSGGDLAPIASLDATLSRLKAYASNTTEAALFGTTMQSALETLDRLAADLAPALLNASATGTPTMIDTLGADARQRFETAIATLNTRAADRSIFAGQATDKPALAGADTILAALDTAIAGALTAADVEAAVDGWFDGPSGYAAVAYLGSDPLAPLPVAEGESARITITALDPAIRDTLKGLALGAVLDRGALSGAPHARADLARRAGDVLMAGQSDRTHLAAGLGIVEAQIDAAQTRNGAEASALQIARSGMVSVDPFEAAARLEATQGQLETLYTITARLTRLSLVDFLR